ncbi:hypothetical protein V1508DRAFT_420184 [Lipomyces doorenjongii]|uniref:uncharacterized protein n=1 Tax=Lipomyces doorenjongii TaxID=383834 RepID=UPI0034CFA290
MHFLAPVRAQFPAVKRKVILQAYVCSRGAHDLAITLSGKPVISYGPGGRSSRTGRVATVFGANGFLGRYLVSKLARHGTIVMVPFREEINKRFLKVTGDLGVVNFVEFDIRNIESIEESVKHSDIVYNLISRDYPTKHFSFYDVHVEATRRIANAVAKYGVDRFIQVSHHDASPDSPSEFLRTKFEAEQVARDIIPNTTIVRPSPMIGWEDKLIKKIISWPSYTVNNAQQEIRPVHVFDVALALQKIGFDDSTAGNTYELYGPEVMTVDAVRQRCELEALKPYPYYNLPKKLYANVSEVLNQILWWPVGCADQVERMTINQKVDKSALTFADIGMKPEKLEDFVGQYVRHYRGNLFQDVAPDSVAERKREREFIHVTR